MKARVKPNLDKILDDVDDAGITESMKNAGLINVWCSTRHKTRCCIKDNPQWFVWEYSENGSYIFHKSWLIFEDPRIEKLINGGGK